jgi:hypothetical protein
MMPIPFRLDDVIEKIVREPRAAEGRRLRQLAGVNLSDQEARALWARVMEHKWLVSERLGRDVGLRVAIIDYFENIYRLRTGKKRNRINGLMRRLLRPSIIHKIVQSLL